MVIFLSIWTCALFCFLSYKYYSSISQASEATGQFHHLIAVLLGLYISFKYSHILFANPIYISNSSLYEVKLLQHINIGYFLYDMSHVLSYDFQFIGHHMITLSGLLIAEYSDYYGLCNAISAIIAELGSIMYNQYNKHKSLENYKGFVACYAFTRVIFLVWTLFLVYKAVQGFKEFGHWTVLVALPLQCGLLTINLRFLAVHVRKLADKLRKDN
jgi:TLC domain